MGWIFEKNVSVKCPKELICMDHLSVRSILNESEVYKQGVMDMGGYEKLPDTEFSIEKFSILLGIVFQNLILGMWEGPGESLELSGRLKRVK